MSKQITLTLPDEVYEQIQRTAAADQRPIAEVLTDTIVQATPIFSVDARRPAMLREQAAFRSMHADLLTTHEGDGGVNGGPDGRAPAAYGTSDHGAPDRPDCARHPTGPDQGERPCGDFDGDFWWETGG